MDKKAFAVIAGILIVTFALTTVIQYYRPASQTAGNFENFPLKIGDWTGQKQMIDQQTMEILNPKEIFAASYTNPQGLKIQVLFDFFSAEAAFGGPHSPRNCLPGSGWVISGSSENKINLNGRAIPAGRFDLRLNKSRQVMDFWYVTYYGETSNDYVFKLYQMLSSLTFRPRDVAFVRFVTVQDPAHQEALKQFETTCTQEIYKFLPFDR
ncbi:MAG TPA: EpsI family protein [candidate division Zixibacteria bacterium]|nr:EpsI family protein [candidate division Zixibacteria bacterium]